ncbi:MAG: hypothetical protein IEMM0008_0478 [bacterium]|nr:MAG: hypothetical protein IEMM0008_0478 [bacterium]
MKRRSKLLLIFFLLDFLYIGSYLIYRSSHIEVWAKDQKAYVIFPKDQKLIYYLYRPLVYVDSKVTGMGFHIGPHK